MSTENQIFKTLSAEPYKDFFVSMLTRDIGLTDAILDLLDNCVDGIHRTNTNNSNAEKPYDGFYADISFSEQSFQIKDNCGGIPNEAFEYAFRMGRDRSKEIDVGYKTVGTYGIGMKRAAFKMGSSIRITTKNSVGTFDILFPKEWLSHNKWEINVTKSNEQLNENGTVVIVDELHPDISVKCGSTKEGIADELSKIIARQFCVIIDKGFKVTINGKEVLPEPMFFAWDSNKNSIEPYIYETKFEGVDIFISVGFRQKLLSEKEQEKERERSTYTSDYAGWTVICNDRAVLYCDKTHLTGWGVHGVPSYHTQFIAISGVVEFTSSDPSKLPTTTTKHGIDLSSKLYSMARERMMEGVQIFTNFTNKWKSDTPSANKLIEKAARMTFQDVKKRIHSNEGLLKKLNKRSDKSYTEFSMRPSLPIPAKISDECRISFKRNKDDVMIVAQYLDLAYDPALVGRTCFEQILREANNG